MRKPVLFSFLTLFLLNILGFSASAMKQNVYKRTDHIDSISLKSPNELVKANVFIRNDKIYYNIYFKDVEIIEPSAIGLQFENDGQEIIKVKFGRISQQYHEENIKLKFGEAEKIHTEYNEISLAIMNSETNRFHFRIMLRIYDEGFSFRYIIPKPTLKPVLINAELTEFAFKDSMIVYTNTWHEDVYKKKQFSEINEALEMPILMTKDDISVFIDEADNQNYERILFRREGRSTLKAVLKNKIKFDSTNYITPWRFIKFAESPEELASSSFFNYTMCANSKLNDESWIVSGKVMRCMSLNTRKVKQCIDFAKKMNFNYVLLDAGWYGLGYNEQYNKASDPKIPISDLDMSAITSYSLKNDIGLILYVNWIGLKHYSLEETFDLYEKWGIKGVKFGFVDGKTQSGIKYIYKAIDIAAKHKLIVNIHDNYRPTGLSRTYPNLLTQEGIRGNEHAPTSKHNTTLPFTRFISGPADYTISFPVAGTLSNTPTTRGHQLALSVIFFSPLQHIFWYRSPGQLTNKTEIEFFKYVPTYWNETVWLSSKIGDFVTVARRSENIWFLGAITDGNDRTNKIPLKFLDSGKEYTATIFSDSASTISIDSIRVKSSDIFTLDLKANGGQSVIFRPVAEPLPLGLGDDLITNKKIQIYPNPGNQLLNLNLNEDIFSNELSHLTIYNIFGQKALSYSINQAENQINISSFVPGIYIIKLEIGNKLYQCKFICK